MRRADRLFEIVQIIRSRRLTTAQYLSDRLEVSCRTVYRDISDLQCAGIPIRGEAGVGYTLDKGFDLPPLMFTRAEIEAVALGANLVRSWADDEMARAAKQAFAKIEVVLPKALRGQMEKTPLFALNFERDEELYLKMSALRGAIRMKHKVRIEYRDARSNSTTRLLRPLCLSFFAPIWMLSAYCELRGEFRNFRLDRMGEIDVTDKGFEDETGKTLDDFLARVTRE